MSGLAGKIRTRLTDVLRPGRGIEIDEHRLSSESVHSSKTKEEEGEETHTYIKNSFIDNLAPTEDLEDGSSRTITI